MTGPVKRALGKSYLAASVRAGLQALPDDTRDRIAENLRSDFVDSIDLDAATRERHANDERWDYLLGHALSSKIIGIETHSASTSQVSKVINKRTKSIDHTRAEFVEGAYVAAWYWVASGRVDFVPHEKTVNRLAQNGIQFVGTRLEKKHLAHLAQRDTGGTGSRKRRKTR
jgi:hypothetical protein